MLPADNVAIETAIAAWTAAGSGLAADHVWWAGQGQPRDEGAWISLNVISDANPTGPAWVDVEDAAEPADGAEIRHVARESVQQIVSIQCFQGAATGAASALGILRQLRASAVLRTPAAVLADAGIGLGRLSPIRNIGGSRNGAFEPRASMDATIFLASETTELGTYIETVADVIGETVLSLP